MYSPATQGELCRKERTWTSVQESKSCKRIWQDTRPLPGNRGCSDHVALDAAEVYDSLEDRDVVQMPILSWL